MVFLLDSFNFNSMRCDMKKNMAGYWIFWMVCAFMIFSGGSLHAGDKKDMGGWGIDDPYNRYYNAADIERFKAVVSDVIEVVPLPGMSPGVALLVKEGGEGDDIIVHLCPVWYKRADRIGIKKGDKISLRGHYTDINGQEVIMAAKIKKKGAPLKVRLTSDGTPFWTMPPAQLKKELSHD